MADVGGGAARFWGSDTASTGAEPAEEGVMPGKGGTRLTSSDVIPVVRGAQPAVGGK